MASRTREKLIDVAKQLFLSNGVENTTISDIATASDKGRRTIYTYFANKREIYKAVIERESENMVGALREIVDMDAPARERLRLFFERRLSMGRNTTDTSYATLRTLVSSDFRRAERIRKLAYEKEESLLRIIIDEGLRTGEFEPSRCRLLLKFLKPLLHALDMADLNSEAPVSSDRGYIQAASEFLMLGVTTED